MLWALCLLNLGKSKWTKIFKRLGLDAIRGSTQIFDGRKVCPYWLLGGNGQHSIGPCCLPRPTRPQVEDLIIFALDQIPSLRLHTVEIERLRTKLGCELD